MKLIMVTMNVEKQQKENDALICVYKALNHPTALKIFQHISENGIWAESDKIRTLAKSKKIFYTAINKLVQSKLISHIKPHKFALTKFGIIVADTINLIMEATKIMYKLQVIDNITKHKLSNNEYTEIVSTLVTNERIRRYLI
jgi:hypothetical protein